MSKHRLRGSVKYHYAYKSRGRGENWLVSWGDEGVGGGRGLEIEFLRSYIDLTARVMENS